MPSWKFSSVAATTTTMTMTMTSDDDNNDDDNDGDDDDDNEGSEMTNGASTILRNSILAKSMGKHQFLNAIMEILYSSSNDNDDNDEQRTTNEQ
jgi:hypothetical protein